MKTRNFYLLLIAVFFAQAALADDGYEQYAKAVRDSVWAWNRPEFKNYNVPDKYKNESAVILAMHEEVYATGKNRIRFTGGGILGFGLNKELNYSRIIRKMIKLNDKQALEDNSELEFKETDKSFGFNVSTLYKGVVGARIIKPDGTIKEVDMSEAVSITEGKKDKEANKKLAVSDLQVGDILDYFYHEEGRIDYENIPEQYFIFASKYPMLSYSVHCELSKNLTNEYHLLNGAPDFTQSANEEGDYVLDVKQTDMPKITAEQWLSPARQFPIIRLLVLYNSNKKIGKPDSAREKGLYKNLPADNILEDAVSVYNGAYAYMLYKDVEKKTKQYIKDNPQADKKQLAQYMGDCLNVYANNAFGDAYWGVSCAGISSNRYIITLSHLLNKYKIEHKTGFVTDRFGVRGNNVSSWTDYTPVLIANDNSQVFTAHQYLYYIGEDYHFEGETAQLFIPQKNTRIKFKETDKRSQMKLPESVSGQNMNKTEMTVSFTADNLLTLDIARKTMLSGFQRNGRYANMILRSDWNETLTRWKGEETDLDKWKKKNKTKDIEEYEATRQEGLKEQEKAVKEEIKGNHDIDVKELKSYSFPALGV